MVSENSSANRNIFQKSDSFEHIKLKCTKLHWNVTIRHNSIHIHSTILYFKLISKKYFKCKIATPINKQIKTQINSLQLHILFSSIKDQYILSFQTFEIPLIRAKHDRNKFSRLLLYDLRTMMTIIIYPCAICSNNNRIGQSFA